MQKHKGLFQNDKIVSLIFFICRAKIFKEFMYMCTLQRTSKVNCTTCIIQGAFNFDVTISQLHQGIMGKSLKIELLYHDFFLNVAIKNQN